MTIKIMMMMITGVVSWLGPTTKGSSSITTWPAVLISLLQCAVQQTKTFWKEKTQILSHGTNTALCASQNHQFWTTAKKNLAECLSWVSLVSWQTYTIQKNNTLSLAMQPRWRRLVIPLQQQCHAKRPSSFPLLLFGKPWVSSEYYERANLDQNREYESMRGETCMGSIWWSLCDVGRDALVNRMQLSTWNIFKADFLNMWRKLQKNYQSD